jgi:quinol monooxygenase YgiN
MFIVHVFIQVKPGDVEDFIKATLANAKASVQEPGILRFDVLQNHDDKHHFVLVEVYRTKDDTARHKETDHYKLWNETVVDMMAVPRSKQIYTGLYTGED